MEPYRQIHLESVRVRLAGTGSAVFINFLPGSTASSGRVFVRVVVPQKTTPKQLDELHQRSRELTEAQHRSCCLPGTETPFIL